MSIATHKDFETIFPAFPWLLAQNPIPCLISRHPGVCRFPPGHVLQGYVIDFFHAVEGHIVVYDEAPNFLGISESRRVVWELK